MMMMMIEAIHGANSLIYQVDQPLPPPYIPSQLVPSALRLESAMAFGFEYMCEHESECPQNIAIFSVSLLSMICVSLVLGRIMWRRWNRRPGPDTSIGRLIEYLVSVTITSYICLQSFIGLFVITTYRKDVQASNRHETRILQELPFLSFSSKQSQVICNWWKGKALSLEYFFCSNTSSIPICCADLT